MNLTILQFDTIAYLDDKNISYVTSGKDVTQGWIGVECSFCDDSGHHLGIHIESNQLSCWKCGPHGNVSNLVQQIEQCNFPQAIQIMEQYQDSSRLINYIPEEKIRQKVLTIPKGYQRLQWGKNVLSSIIKFLESRDFPAKEYIGRNELYYGGFVGDMKFRIIFPVYFHRRLVTFVGRDITGKSNIPYLALEEEKSVYPTKELLYGYDDVAPGNVIPVVEGIIDQQKLGKGSVATFGTAWKIEQVSLLRQLYPRKIVILYDSEEEAQKQAIALSHYIWFCESEVIMLEEVNDPGELTLEQGKELMNNLQRWG
jgi:DNA primase